MSETVGEKPRPETSTKSYHRADCPYSEYEPAGGDVACLFCDAVADALAQQPLPTLSLPEIAAAAFAQCDEHCGCADRIVAVLAQQAQPLMDCEIEDYVRERLRARSEPESDAIRRALTWARDRMTPQQQRDMPTREQFDDAVFDVLEPEAEGYFALHADELWRVVLALFALKETTCEHGERGPHRVPGTSPSASGSWSGPYICHGPQ